MGETTATADPKNATLRRALGIVTNMDSPTQERLSLDLRRDICWFAHIGYSKTWTELEGEGIIEGMVNSM